jgi:hypothetical protein
MTVGSRSASRSGLLMLAQVGTTRSGYRRWALDAIVQLFEIPSPVADERYRAIDVLMGRSFGSTFAISPAAGLEYRSWSGPQRVEDSDVGMVVGVRVGRSLHAGGSILLLPELAWQFSLIEAEGSVGGSVLSLRLNFLHICTRNAR